MRFGWIVLLMLSFPVMEAVGIFWAASAIGGWVLFWLLLSAIAGIALIRFERVAWGARMLFTVQSGVDPLASLFASGRILLAGGLLVFPGFISDAIAVLLLLSPGAWSRHRRDPLRPANDAEAPPQATPPWNETPRTPPQTINGEFKREPDEGPR